MLTQTAEQLSGRKDLLKGKSVAPMQARIGKLHERTDAEGRRRIGAARKARAANKHAESLTCYWTVVADFPRRPCADEARKALADAAADPKRKALLARIEATETDKAIARAIARAEPAGKKGGKPKTRVVRIKALSPAAQKALTARLDKLAKLHPDLPEGRRAADDAKALRGQTK